MKKTKVKASRSTLLIISLLLAAAAIAVIALEVAGNFIKQEKSILVEDHCGVMVNYISHTIADADACRLKCRNQCEAADYKYKASEFIARDVGCNNCTCSCEK